jgi:hypothetical protein
MRRRILYYGALADGQTSLYRMRALVRLRQQVIPFDLTKYQFKWGKLNALCYRFPVGPLIAKINADLLAAVRTEKPDLVWLEKPTHLTPKTIRCIKEAGAQTVCFTQDSPFGPRKDGCWYQFNRIYRMLDLHCLFRTADIPRYQAWGLNYLKIQLSYDPLQHFPPPPVWSDKNRTREVSYLGSPFEDRARFLRTLLEAHRIPLVISGQGWQKVIVGAERERLTRAGNLQDQGGMLKDGDYRECIWRSKINLAFVTHLNEEDVAHKAFEITACGGFLLALRTAGHQECFEEGKEAEFFSSIEECADKIRYYLAHPAERQEIARRGCERAQRSGYDNDTQLSRVLARLEEMRPL